ncbi:MAG: aromatic amino acid lyase, partial [Crocinitomicaceae bacterium]
MSVYTIDNQWVSIDNFESILSLNYKITLGEKSKKAIVDCRNFLDRKVAESDKLIYGINTGFGSLCNTAISNQDLEQLQRNLV